LGDKQHSLNADKWVDLKSGFELPRYNTGTGQWLSNGFQALNDSSSFYHSSFPGTFPAGGASRTIEVIFRTPAPPMFTQEIEVQRLIFSYGAMSTSHQFGIEYRGQTSSYWSKPDGCSPENRWMFYPITGYVNNLVTCLSSTPSLETPNTINTVTSTYANSIQNADSTNSYINNVPAEVLVRQGSVLNTTDGPLIIGQYLPGSTFLSVRLYNRVLKPEEITKNAALDQKRYLTPPTVTIGGASCTEVVVLSPHFLMCKVPPSATTGTRDVVVNGNIIYSGAYTYVAASEFYVSSISPIVGSGGETLTLTGNRLGEITKVEVGGAECTNLSVVDAETFTCTLPPLSKGEVDIMLTVGSNSDVYRFAKVFEYQ
jgi:hypothetical protein